MNTIDLMGELELIEIKQKPFARRGYCTIASAKNVFNIPKAKADELKWDDRQRVNLYSIGSTFVLKPDKTGLVTVRATGNGSMRVCSTNFCLELMSRTRSCRTYEAWVEKDALFFRPERREDE